MEGKKENKHAPKYGKGIRGKGKGEKNKILRNPYNKRIMKD
ncbi:hypothetical protein ABCY62_03625 [Acetivibrio clariflavus]